MSDDADLEREFRDGLRRAADRAEVDAPLAARAYVGARTRRRRRWAVVGAVAAVVAFSGVAVAVQSHPSRQPTDRGVSDQTVAPPVTEWRAESWHGLTVDVPADWGWGTAPVRLDPGGDGDTAYFCGGPGAAVAVGGGRPAEPKRDTPWVGRPIMLSDACGNDPDWVPTAPYVWLGADVEPGTVELGDGYTQETVESFGTTLTVASQDAALRQHVLDSARGNTDCGTQLAERPAQGPIPIEGLDPIHSAQLCAYQRDYDDHPYDLVYATVLDQATAQQLYSGKGLTGRQGTPDFCDAPGSSFVVVTFSGKDRMGDAELTSDAVIDPGCRQIRAGGGVLPLTERGMQVWSQNGLQVILHAFIGMLG